MTPYYAYQAYQAARVTTSAERRRADAELGRLAAAVSQLCRDITRPARSVRVRFQDKASHRRQASPPEALTRIYYTS